MVIPLSTSPKRENRLTALSPPYAERTLALRDGRMVTLRAVSSGDGAEIIQGFDRLSTDSRYSRFMQHKKQLDPAALSRGLNPERGREFVLLATIPAADGIDIVGAAQYLQADVNNATSCEFAITLAEDWRGSGLGSQLMSDLLRQAATDGYALMEGLVIADNLPMVTLARRLDFQVERVSGDATVVRVSRGLDSLPPRLPTTG